jgi:CheY-like chemotaxis protein
MKIAILVIDDDQIWHNDLQSALRAQLKCQGAEVEYLQAESLEQGLEIAERRKTAQVGSINVVVMDRILSDPRTPQAEGHAANTSGLDLGTIGVQVLTMYRLVGSDCPIIVATANETYKDCVAATLAGASAYVPKYCSNLAARDIDREYPSASDYIVEVCKSFLGTAAAPRRQVSPVDSWVRTRLEHYRSSHPNKWFGIVPLNAVLELPIEFDLKDGDVGLFLGDTYEAVRTRILVPELLSRKVFAPIVR